MAAKIKQTGRFPDSSALDDTGFDHSAVNKILLGGQEPRVFPGPISAVAHFIHTIAHGSAPVALRVEILSALQTYIAGLISEISPATTHATPNKDTGD